MRTTQRDGGGVVTFGATVTDAASGAGVAQPGAIPFIFTREATGVYRVRFDPRLTTLHAQTTGGAGGLLVTTDGWAAGSFRVVAVASTTAAQVNGNFGFLCTVRDGRS